ncbi:hypothetical protein GW791_01900 [Candidatus Saccharibacteria bacterium]|nr:hypothetical protein [Candidatus Saccharibacteria bacterium]
MATDIIKPMLKIKSSKYTEFCGWYGMAALILAYAFVSFGILSPSGVIFQLLNLTGSVGLIIDAISKKILQVALLNLFWAIIGIVMIIQLFFLTQ